ncbi:alpha/beta hydrolase [Flavobacterium sp. MAH-1]|uniref:Alpha/beta hydrolase n=1 Tax=Flavobacterium agri TaxID=2743471 RepID=A0A7Y8Y1P9_9FLAO|nr:alpha/beta hydrolase [Flavobacterium agri]NUY80980.1 alpha/beta hydrolase [Flavobacterium agri]NYA71004.1 alpha/beta hydrolase [Flavobacterium agri]
MQKIRYFILTKSIGLYVNLLSFLLPKKGKEVVYYFFSKPRDGKLRHDALPELLAKTHRETISLNGDTIQTYTWKGNGAVILLAHGWDSNSWRWEKLLPFLQASGSTIVALDAPDHGLSQGSFSLPKYAAFINAAAEKFKPDYLIGHSIGGSASLYYQHLYQNPKLRKLVMLGSPAELNPIIDNYDGLLGLTRKSRELLNQYFMEHFNFHPDNYTARIFGKTLNLDGLVAHDTEDDVVRFTEMEKISDAWSKAKVIKTSGLGHSMHGDELYGEVARFLFED